MVNVLELLDSLAAAEVGLAVHRGGRLVTDAPNGVITAELALAISHHRDLVIAIIRARSTGHAPGVCDACGEVSLVNIWDGDGRPRSTWPTCRLTPGCHGRHVPRPCDAERTARVAPPKQARPPRKQSHAILLGPKQAGPIPPARPDRMKH